MWRCVLGGAEGGEGVTGTGSGSEPVAWITDTADVHVSTHDSRKGWYPQTAHVFRILHLVCIQDT